MYPVCGPADTSLVFQDHLSLMAEKREEDAAHFSYCLQKRLQWCKRRNVHRPEEIILIEQQGLIRLLRVL